MHITYSQIAKEAGWKCHCQNCEPPPCQHEWEGGGKLGNYVCVKCGKGERHP